MSESGWYLTVTLRAEAGISRVQAVAFRHLGSVTISELDDVLQRDHEELMDRPPPGTEFRYRWVRDIGQQYETQLRAALSGRVPEFAWLARPASFGRRPRRQIKGYGPRFYAEMARRFVELDGSLEALAAHERVPWSTAKEWISRASRDGYLTRPGKGRRGARQLTPLAAEVLKEKEA